MMYYIGTSENRNGIREHFQKLVKESKRNVLCNSGCNGKSVEDLDKKGVHEIGENDKTGVNNKIIEKDETHN